MKFKSLRKLFTIKGILALFVGVAILLYLNSSSIASQTQSSIYSDIQTIPPKKIALLLGTSKYIPKGGENYFYTYRIEAVVALYRAHKIRGVLISGDNSTKYYDEPTMMMDDLVKMGIPRRYITRDYAGFRTLDSIIRAKEIFELDDFIIVSQRFHLERALAMAHAKGSKAIGFVAKDIPQTAAAYRMQFREYLARGAMLVDLYLLNREAKFLGKKEVVGYRGKPQSN